MRVVVTGHRPGGLPGGYDWTNSSNMAIRRWLWSELNKLRDIHKDKLKAGSGMALGVDQFFSHMSSSLSIPWIAFVPCNNQARMWPKMAQNRYVYIISFAKDIIFVSDKEYFHGCMQDRNIAMRDWALEDEDNLLLAVHDGSPGGTGNMVKACEGKMPIKRYDPIKGRVV